MARVLVIDDDPGCQAAMRRVLVLEGHDVLIAGGGEEGMALLHDFHAELVVVDLLMPGMDGVRTVQAIRSRFPETRILVATGAHDMLADDLLSGAAWLGDASTLSKPFDEPEFLAAVRALLDA